MIGPEDHRVFQEIVERDRRFALITHMNPDGDALGSQLGLAYFLIDRGKDVVIVNHDPTPSVLSFLDRGAVAIEVYDPDMHDDLLSEVDRIVLLDNSATDRLGGMERRALELAGRVLCIDHHPTRGTAWAHTILDTGSCAAAAMVHELTVATGWTASEAAAEALYVGIATDTGFFRFNSTTPGALRICAEMMDCGVDPARCYGMIYERNSPDYTRILGEALSGLRLDADGRVVSVSVVQTATRGAEDVDTSEMTTPLLAIDGVRIALLFRELDDGRVKVSLRSKGSLDVHALALAFGGGGHRNASGIVATGSLAEVSNRVIEAATAVVERTEDPA